MKYPKAEKQEGRGETEKGKKRRKKMKREIKS